MHSFADNHTLFDKTGSSDETIQQSEFIMRQLLLLCGCFDYSDEIGRYVQSWPLFQLDWSIFPLCTISLNLNLKMVWKIMMTIAVV